MGGAPLHWPPPAGSLIDVSRPSLLQVPGLPTLVVSHLPQARSISLLLLVRVGSRDDPPGLEGMAHLLEHMLFQGTRRHPGAREVVTALDRVGGDLNAETDRECTGLAAQVPAGHLELAVASLADLVEAPLLRSRDLAKERQVVKEEIAVYEDSPEDFVHDLLRRAAWSSHPLSHTELGDEESVSRIHTVQLRSFLHRHYVVESMVLSVAGRTEARAVLDAARRVPWPRGSAVPRSQAPPGPQAEALLDEQDTEETHIALAVPALPLSHPKRSALLLLNDLLGGSMTSRLFQELREVRGLVYDIESELDLLSDCGLWTVSTSVRPERAAEALRLVGYELGRLARGQIRDDELEHIRGHHLGAVELYLESPLNLAEIQGRTWFLEGRLLDEEAQRQEVEAVTLEEMRSLAGRLLLPERVSLALVGPDHPIEAMGRALSSCWQTGGS